MKSSKVSEVIAIDLSDFDLEKEIKRARHKDNLKKRVDITPANNNKGRDRNKSCPCGKALKFKHCCWDK